MPVDEILKGKYSRNLFTYRLSCIVSRVIYLERNKSFSFFFSLSLVLSIPISCEGSRSSKKGGRTTGVRGGWRTREDACGYRWKEGSKEEKRRERGRRAGESVGDSCRGVAGSISVDRRHKLFQWTRSSGSISLPPSLSLSLSLSLSPSFRPFHPLLSRGPICAFQSGGNVFRAGYFPRFPCPSTNHRFDPSLKRSRDDWPPIAVRSRETEREELPSHFSYFLSERFPILISILSNEGVAKVREKIFRLVEIVKERRESGEAVERNSRIINCSLFRGRTSLPPTASTYSRVNDGLVDCCE